MAHKKKHGSPTPPDNQPKAGPAGNQPGGQGPVTSGELTSSQEQDPKRRLGDFTGAGEHSFQQPGGRNDANH